MNKPRTRQAQAFVMSVTLAAAGALLVSGLTETADASLAPTQSSASTATATAGSSSSAGAASKTTRNKCGRTRLAAPRCGVLWGVYMTPRPSGRGAWKHGYVPLEKKIGRRFDVVKGYQAFDSAHLFPNSLQKRLAKGHRLWEYSWSAKVFSSGKRLTYASIANGDYDRSVIRPQAKKLKRWGRKTIVDFDHEMDGPKAAGIGGSKEYVRAYRHIVKVFREVGTKNVLWAWVPTGFDTNRIKPFYPGKRYVDWIGYDPYNFYSCSGARWKSPRQTFEPFYRWVGSQKGMRGKPILLGEYATVNGSRAGKWYSHVARALKGLPRIKAVMQFSSSTSGACDFRLNKSSTALRGFKKSSTARYVLGR